MGVGADRGQQKKWGSAQPQSEGLPGHGGSGPQWLGAKVWA